MTTGEALKQDLIERNGFPAQRIDSVPTGIDAARFRPGDRAAARALLNLPRDRQLVGVVAGLRSGKGHRFLIEALPPQAHLVVVGDGPMRSILEDLVVKKNLKERVVFVGNQVDVAPWLQALDVFALPSDGNEGVPQALVQAMLTGLPCVTHRRRRHSGGGDPREDRARRACARSPSPRRCDSTAADGSGAGAPPGRRSAPALRGEFLLPAHARPHGGNLPAGESVE